MVNQRRLVHNNIWLMIDFRWWIVNHRRSIYDDRVFSMPNEGKGFLGIKMIKVLDSLVIMMMMMTVMVLVRMVMVM